MPEKGKGVITGMGTFFAHVDELPKILSNYKGATLHVTLNDTDDKGRKSINMVSPRVLLVDIDRPIERSEVKNLIYSYKVQLAVESSPNKWHFYWSIDSAISLKEWSIFELGLSYKFQADLQSSQITKSIRVPGVERLTKDGDPFMPEIKFLVEKSARAPLTREVILKEFPWILSSHHKALAYLKKEHEALRDLMKKKLELSNIKKFKKINLQGRNNLLYFEVKRHVAAIKIDPSGKIMKPPSFEAAVEYGKLVNEAFSEPLTELECVRTIQSAFKNGVALYKKKYEEFRKVRGDVVGLFLDETVPET